MTERSDKDLELWREWNSRGRKPEDMEPLLNQFEPMIMSHLRRYSGHVNIPEPVLRADLENRFAKAVKTFDPNRGTQLSTHVDWHLRGVHGFVAQNQNLGRIPESQIPKIRALTAAVHTLQDELGKVPDDAAVASKLHWSPTQVKRLRRSLRKDLLSTSLPVPVGTLYPSPWEAVKALLPAELTPKERFVFEHTTGAGGAKIMQAQEMAKKLRISNAGISRIRSRIAEKIESYTSQLPSGQLAPFGGGDTDTDMEED